jgi:hypothetical protein
MLDEYSLFSPIGQSGQPTTESPAISRSASLSASIVSITEAAAQGDAVGASGDTRRLSMYDRDLGLIAHGVKYAYVVAAVRWQLGSSWLASDQAEPLGDAGGDGADADHCSSGRERSRPYSLWLKR